MEEQAVVGEDAEGEAVEEQAVVEVDAGEVVGVEYRFDLLNNLINLNKLMSY